MVVERRVSEVMTTPVRSVSTTTPLQEAVQLMSDHHISALAVVDEAGALVGELTEQDLMVRESGFDAGPYVQLPAAARQLHDRSTQRLFVLDAANQPVGVLTRGDVVRALANA